MKIFKKPHQNLKSKFIHLLIHFLTLKTFIMKKTINSALACFAFFGIISCKKTITTAKDVMPTTVAANVDEATLVHSSKWFGVYSQVGYPNDTVADKTFIANGIATLTKSPWSYYFTSIELNIPRCQEICGDSTKLKVRLRNPADTIGSISAYDVALWLIGSKDSALVLFNAYYPQYTEFKIGDHQILNSNALLYLFQDWTTLTLEAKNKNLTVYRDNTKVLSLNYQGDKLGRLKQIHIDFKGSGQVDWVKIFNSNTGNKLMQEDFNIDGRSHVIWY